MTTQTLHISVLYFASIREAIGTKTELVVSPAATLGELRELLIARGGVYATSLAHGKAVRMAHNQVLGQADTVLADGDEVAFFPPVTGG